MTSGWKGGGGSDRRTSSAKKGKKEKGHIEGAHEGKWKENDDKRSAVLAHTRTRSSWQSSSTAAGRTSDEDEGEEGSQEEPDAEAILAQRSRTRGRREGAHDEGHEADAKTKGRYTDQPFASGFCEASPCGSPAAVARLPRHSEVLHRRAGPLLVDSLLLKRDHPRARRSPPTPSGSDYDVYGALLSALSSPLLSVLPSPVPFTSSSSASPSPSISSSPSTRLAALLSPTLHSTPKWDETYDNVPFSPLVAPAPCSSSPPPSPIEALSLITYAAPEEPAGLAHFPPTPTAPAARACEQKDVPPRPVPCSRWSTSTLASGSVYSAHVLRAPASPRPARPRSPSRGGTSPTCPTPTPPRAPASQPRQRCWASTRRARPVADARGRRVVGVGLGGASSSASPMPMPPTHFLAKSTSGFSGQRAAKLVIHKSIESGIGARQASVWSIASEEAHEKEVHKEVHEEEIHEEVHEEEWYLFVGGHYRAMRH
ncbi:hypothetical protein FB451DRAFT_1564859 [Mycena latifolia]|nr:hypothetical protein FB451DRAFT_1564859 [Mycena latifolia]